jgi:hypothetical protein
MISISYFSDLARFNIWILSFDWVTGLAGLIFFINQNDIILVKRNKNQRVTTRFLTESCRINRATLGFSYPFFFI